MSRPTGRIANFDGEKCGFLKLLKIVSVGRKTLTPSPSPKGGEGSKIFSCSPSPPLGEGVRG
jgi:hypothetical protein